MIYAHTNINEMSACDEGKEIKKVKEAKEAKEAKELGIYEQTKETRQILTEVLFALNQFKREIRDYNTPEGESSIEPSCFKDEVSYINSLAFAIRGDLIRLMDEFH